MSTSSKVYGKLRRSRSSHKSNSRFITHHSLTVFVIVIVFVQQRLFYRHRFRTRKAPCQAKNQLLLHLLPIIITPAINLVRRCDGSEKTYYPSIALVIVIVQAPIPHRHRVSVAILYFFNKLRTTTDTSTKIGEHYFFFFTVFVLASTFILSFEKRISQSVCIVWSRNTWYTKIIKHSELKIHN